MLETFSNIIFNFILKNIDYWIEAIGYELMDCPSIHGWKPTVMQGEKAEKVCTTDISDKGKAAPKLYMIACNIYGAMLVIQETGGFKSFFSWDTKNFKAELKGTDYCQGIGGGEE